MSDNQSRPPEQPDPSSSIMLGCLGATLLLPGLCSLAFIPFLGVLLSDRNLWGVWVIGLLIGGLGVALIRSANRSSRRN
jgi:hypothetical protein